MGANQHRAAINAMQRAENQQPATDLLPLLRECLVLAGAWRAQTTSPVGSSATTFEASHSARQHYNKLKAAIARLESEAPNDQR